MNPVEALVKSGLVASHSEARRVVESGGFRVGEDKIPVSDINDRIDDEVIWCGKKKGSVKLDLESLFAKAIAEFHSQKLGNLENEPNYLMRFYITMEWMFKAGYNAREREEIQNVGS